MIHYKPLVVIGLLSITTIGLADSTDTSTNSNLPPSIQNIQQQIDAHHNAAVQQSQQQVADQLKALQSSEQSSLDSYQKKQQAKQAQVVSPKENTSSWFGSLGDNADDTTKGGNASQTTQPATTDAAQPAANADADANKTNSPSFWQRIYGGGDSKKNSDDSNKQASSNTITY